MDKENEWIDKKNNVWVYATHTHMYVYIFQP